MMKETLYDNDKNDGDKNDGDKNDGDKNDGIGIPAKKREPHRSDAVPLLS